MQALFLIFTIIKFVPSNAVLGPVTGAVSGVTGGLSGSQASDITAADSDHNVGHGSNDFPADGEYFAIQDLPKCGLNEYYEFCGSTCLETCKSHRYNFSIPKDCKERCDEGCFCEPGYRRHPSTGACLLESCCPEKDDRVYFSCEATVKYCGGKYEVFREEFNSCLESCLMETEVCSNEVFYKGCYCENGYKRNYKNVCVPVNDCYLKDEGYLFQTTDSKHD